MLIVDDDYGAMVVTMMMMMMICKYVQVRAKGAPKLGDKMGKEGNISITQWENGNFTFTQWENGNINFTQWENGQGGEYYFYLVGKYEHTKNV